MIIRTLLGEPPDRTAGSAYDHQNVISRTLRTARRVPPMIIRTLLREPPERTTGSAFDHQNVISRTSKTAPG